MSCIVALIGFSATTTGCHGPLKPIFDEVTPPITWPSGAARARLRYVGQLTSSADLKPQSKPFQGIVDFFVGATDPEPLYGPRTVVTTNGGARVWIADPGGGCLHLFDLQERAYTKIVRAGDEHFLSPSGLCTGPDETIFMCDTESATIHQLSERDGALRRTLRLTEELSRPVALFYDHAGDELFVVDVAAHDIKVFGVNGRLVRVIGQRGNLPGEFNYPCDIAGADDMIWVADAGNQRVQGLTRDGDPVVIFGEAGDAPGQMALPKGIATDSDGNVYVVDGRFENVQIFDRSGNLLLVIGEEGQAPGQFWLPGGIFIDPNDRVWICDTYNRRVQVLDRIKDTRIGD